MVETCVLLPNGAASFSTQSTIIVSGTSRSGTSLVAAALKAVGLWLGDNLDNACFEDVDIATAVERSTPWPNRLAGAVGTPKRAAMALRGIDVERLASAIARRDAAYGSWGFKRPNILKRLGPDGLAMFRSPRAILCFRDPVALAQRSAKADGVPFERALKTARHYLNENLGALQRLECPVLLVSFEKLKADPLGFLPELYRFCGLEVASECYPAVAEFIDRAGCEYRRVASAPKVGYLDRPLGWSLSGWCCPPNATGPAAVDVWANGVKLITTLANRYRPDLRDAGFRTAEHGFTVDLRRFGLRGTEIIDVMLAGTVVKLEDSGFGLAAAA